jgi:hypothetical protein
MSLVYRDAVRPAYEEYAASNGVHAGGTAGDYDL